MEKPKSIQLFQNLFGLEANLRKVDFRPHFNGDLVNIGVPIKPLPTASETKLKVWEFVVKVAKWILDNRKLFGAEDRFGIVIGWDKSIRLTGRQIATGGGTYDEVESLLTFDSLDSCIASGGKMKLMPGWDKGIFDAVTKGEK